MRSVGLISFNLVLFTAISLFSELSGFVDLDTTRRFEYKLSFKPPTLVFKDGTVPFWQHHGSTICSNDQIRLTPSIRSQKGRIWSNHQMTNDDWEIEVTMRINGRGRVGADGMAIWYTDKVGGEGPVFGSNDRWNGLGIFLDSFDNDAQQNNPYILVMTNDGTKQYDHHRDGLNQQIGGCLRDFRNKPFPVALKIEYYKRVLTVYYHNGLKNNDKTYQEICARVENIDLPKNGYFGVSAATGGLADDHDVLSFLTYSLNHNNNPSQPNPEQKKYDEEYEKFVKQLELEKENYNKEHPNEQEDIDDEKNYEDESERQFRTILDVQNSIHQSIRTLDSKFAEVLGRQERIVSMLTGQIASQNQNQNQNQRQNQNQQLPQGDTFNRMEVNQVMNQQNELVRSVRDLQNSVIDVQQKANLISQTVKNPPPQAQPQAQLQQNLATSGQMQQIADDLKNFRFEMNSMIRANKPSCPDVSNCLSSMFFMIMIAIQSIVFILYFIYKNRSENQMKKFY